MIKQWSFLTNIPNILEFFVPIQDLWFQIFVKSLSIQPSVQQRIRDNSNFHIWTCFLHIILKRADNVPSIIVIILKTKNKYENLKKQKKKQKILRHLPFQLDKLCYCLILNSLNTFLSQFFILLSDYRLILFKIINFLIEMNFVFMKICWKEKFLRLSICQFFFSFLKVI